MKKNKVTESKAMQDAIKHACTVLNTAAKLEGFAVSVGFTVSHLDKKERILTGAAEVAHINIESLFNTGDNLKAFHHVQNLEVCTESVTEYIEGSIANRQSFYETMFNKAQEILDKSVEELAAKKYAIMQDRFLQAILESEEGKEAGK